MRFLPVMLLSLLLGACSGMDLFAPGPPQSFSAPGPCGALAQQRLEDARMSGLVDGVEKAAFDYTYQDCLKQTGTAR